MSKWPAIVIGAVDAVLLMVILISVVTGWRIGAPKLSSSEPHIKPPVSATERTVPRTEASTGEPVAETTKKPEPTEKATEKVTKKPEPTEKATEKPTQSQTEAHKPAYPSAKEIGTNKGPTLSDIQGFKWNKNDGAYWELLTSSAVKLTDFDAVSGGWKAYILDDPAGKRSQFSMEHFANISLSGKPSDAKATIDWIYLTLSDEGEGHDDASPNSVFSGEWSSGTFTGIGSGKLTLNDFYLQNEKEYGVGTYIWPDGVESIVALVRP